MGWVTRDGRSELSWVDQTLGSISAPPMQLLAFLAVLILFMSVSSHTETEKTGLKFLLCLLALALFLVTFATMRHRFTSGVRTTGLTTESGKQDGSSPWGVAFIVIVVLVLVKYHS